MRSALGPTIVTIGALLVVVGLLVWTGALSWFGRLPGDIRVERESMRLYVPITSMVLVSLALTVIGWVVRRFF